MNFRSLRSFRSLARTLLLLLTPALAAAQTTIHVPADQPTIQAGINAANTGDTVLVAPGTYTENIDFKGKAITVTSSGGAAVTTIDGAQKTSAVVFKSQETRASVLSGFTIQHGGVLEYPQAGYPVGGIYVHTSSPTIRNNIFLQNSCYSIYSATSAPSIENNVISATRDPQGHCTFSGGTAVFISANLNFAKTTDSQSSAIVAGNIIENNVESGFEDAGGNGGAAISVWGQGSPIILNNTLRNNTTLSGTGAAINVVDGAGLAIAQNLIYNNSAGCGGGALAIQVNPDPRTGISALVINNTIVNNLGQGPGGFSDCSNIAQIYPSPGSYGSSTPSILILNNIISGATSYPAVNCGVFFGGGEAAQPSFQNDLLFNAGGPFFGSHCADVSAKYNNIVADPLFVNVAQGDFHLQNTSPAIDHGQNAAVQLFNKLTGLTLSTDLDGNPRTQDATGQGCTVDVGAYEFPGTKSICGTSETLTSSSNPALLGQAVTFTAQLASASGIPTGGVQFTDGATVLGTQPISSAGLSTFTTSLLSIGTHTITATYQPSGNFPATNTSLSQVVSAFPTTTTLTSSPTPSTYLQPVTFAAHVASSLSTAGTPTGTITFLDGNTPLATIPVDNAGNATFTTASLTASAQPHTVVAQYTPTGNFAPSSAQLAQTVSGLATATTLTVSPLSGQSTDTYTMVATVANTSGTTFGIPPSGTVNFYFNGYGASANFAPLVNGIATFQATGLYPGQNIVTAVYHGDTAYSGSASSPVILNINGAPTTLTLTSSANPGVANAAFTLTAHLAASSAPVPAGTPIQLTLGSTQIALTTDANGLATYAESLPAPGTYAFSATFAGKNNLLPSTASLTEVVTGISTATTLSASPNPAYAGQLVTLTATATAAGAPDTTGTLTFYDGPTSLGTATLTPTGQATLTTSTLSVGTHTLTASLAPNGNLLSSASAPVQLTVLPSTFAVTLNPATLTLQAGKAGTATVTLSSIGTFAGPLTLSTGSLPTYASASFVPSTATLASGGIATASLRLNTAQDPGAPLTASTTPPPHPGPRWPLVLSAALLLPLGFRRSRRLRHALAILLIAIASQALTGCGTVGYPFHLVAPGTYRIPIIATAADNSQHSAILTLTITP